MRRNWCHSACRRVDRRDHACQMRGIARNAGEDPSRAQLRRALRSLRTEYFSATQVARGKPAPDLFLFAAEHMKAEPSRCLVIEDPVPGVTGGRAAGMTVL